jgi:uncharacterized membrane protein YidH (DUF202 family)
MPVDPNTVIANIKANIINPIVVLLFSFALLYFLWGVFDFVRHSSSEDKRSDGKQHMLWGIIGMAIMVSAFGIINLICNTINCVQ